MVYGDPPGGALCRRAYKGVTGAAGFLLLRAGWHPCPCRHRRFSRITFHTALPARDFSLSSVLPPPFIRVGMADPAPAAHNTREQKAVQPGSLLCLHRIPSYVTSS